MTTPSERIKDHFGIGSALFDGEGPYKPARIEYGWTIKGPGMNPARSYGGCEMIKGRDGDPPLTVQRCAEAMNLAWSRACAECVHASGVQNWTQNRAEMGRVAPESSLDESPFNHHLVNRFTFESPSCCNALIGVARAVYMGA